MEQRNTNVTNDQTSELSKGGTKCVQTMCGEVNLPDEQTNDWCNSTQEMYSQMYSQMYCKMSEKEEYLKKAAYEYSH